MSSEFPVEDRIFVLKNDQSLGPFEIDEILALLEKGELGYEDICLREGSIETERLRDILDWEEERHELVEADELETENEGTGEEEAPPSSPLHSPAEILYRGSRSIVTFPLSFIGLVGGAIGAIWLYPIDAKLMILCLVASLASLGFLSLMRFTCEYYITPKRIELEKGLIAKSSNEVRITDIRSINVTCEGLSGILGVGTVDFFTTGDKPEVSFRDVWAAREVKKLVRKLQDSDG